MVKRPSVFPLFQQDCLPVKKKKKSPLSTILISINGRVIFAEYLLSVHTFPSWGWVHWPPYTARRHFTVGKLFSNIPRIKHLGGVSWMHIALGVGMCLGRVRHLRFSQAPGMIQLWYAILWKTPFRILVQDEEALSCHCISCGVGNILGYSYANPSI